MDTGWANKEAAFGQNKFMGRRYGYELFALGDSTLYTNGGATVP